MVGRIQTLAAIGLMIGALGAGIVWHQRGAVGRCVLPWLRCGWRRHQDINLSGLLACATL
jgi:hypothetical protein